MSWSKLIDKGKRAHRAMKIVTDVGGKRCIALDPVTNLCTIYESRPDVCRDFQRGCQSCIQAVLMVRDKMDEYGAYLKASAYEQKHPVQVTWKESREFHSGHRRYRIDGVWGQWICYGCYQSAWKIKNIRHERRCRKNSTYVCKENVGLCDK
jgi:Fe-S-cluster containining protein